MNKLDFNMKYTNSYHVGRSGRSVGVIKFDLYEQAVIN